MPVFLAVAIFIATLVVGIGGMVRARKPSARSLVGAELDERGLWLSGRLLIPGRDMLLAWRWGGRDEPGTRAYLRILADKKRCVELKGEDAAIDEMMTLCAPHAREKCKTMAIVSRFWFPAMFGLMWGGRLIEPPGLRLAVSLGMFCTIAAFFRGTLTLADDGITVKRHASRRQSYAYHDLAEAWQGSRWIQFVFKPSSPGKSGKEVTAHASFAVEKEFAWDFLKCRLEHDGLSALSASDLVGPASGAGNN